MAIKVITVSPRVYGKYPAKLAHALYLSAVIPRTVTSCVVTALLSLMPLVAKQDILQSSTSLNRCSASRDS